MNTPIGLKGIKHWNSTWKHHHLPVKFKKRIRFEAIRDEKWKANYSVSEDFMPSELFDHWGSFIPEGETQRQMASMPYGGNDVMVKLWAERHGMDIAISDDSPYGEGTKFYVFKI